MTARFQNLLWLLLTSPLLAGTSPGKSIFPVRPLQPGGAPSGMKLKFHRVNPLEIFHATHYYLTRKICIFNIFSELSVVCAHAHAGHTHAIYVSRVRWVFLSFVHLLKLLVV